MPCGSVLFAVQTPVQVNGAEKEKSLQNPLQAVYLCRITDLTGAQPQPAQLRQ
jgi:hypothetical protein